MLLGRWGSALPVASQARPTCCLARKLLGAWNADRWGFLSLLAAAFLPASVWAQPWRCGFGACWQAVTAALASPLTAPFVLWPPSLLLRASLPFPPGPTGTSLAPALLSRQTTCWRVGFDRADPCLIAVETLPPDPCPSTALFPSFLQRRGS